MIMPTSNIQLIVLWTNSSVIATRTKSIKGSWRVESSQSASRKPSAKSSMKNHVPTSLRCRCHTKANLFLTNTTIAEMVIILVMNKRMIFPLSQRNSLPRLLRMRLVSSVSTLVSCTPTRSRESSKMSKNACLSTSLRSKMITKIASSDIARWVSTALLIRNASSRTRLCLRNARAC